MGCEPPSDSKMELVIEGLIVRRSDGRRGVPQSSQMRGGFDGHIEGGALLSLSRLAHRCPGAKDFK